MPRLLLMISLMYCSIILSSCWVRPSTLAQTADFPFIEKSGIRIIECSGEYTTDLKRSYNSSYTVGIGILVPPETVDAIESFVCLFPGLISKNKYETFWEEFETERDKLKDTLLESEDHLYLQLLKKHFGFWFVFYDDGVYEFSDKSNNWNFIASLDLNCDGCKDEFLATRYKLVHR